MALFKRLGNILRSYVEGAVPDGLPFASREDTDASPGSSHRQTAPPPEDPEMRRMREYYANLELPYGSSFEEIKAAYKRMLKQYHPDVYHQSPEKRQIAEKVSQRLNEAYQFFESKFNKGELK